MITRPCAGCGKTFRLRASSTKQYCSPACYLQYAPKRKQVGIICFRCGQEFLTDRPTTAKYCSQACRNRGAPRTVTPKPLNRKGHQDILSWSINRLLKEGFTRYCPLCLDYYQNEAPAVCFDCDVAIENIVQRVFLMVEVQS